MSSLTRTEKASVTRAVIRVEAAINTITKLTAQPPVYPSEAGELRKVVKKYTVDISEARVTLDHAEQALDNAMSKYKEAYSELEGDEEAKEESKWTEYGDKAVETSEKALDATLDLRKLERGLEIQISFLTDEEAVTGTVATPREKQGDDESDTVTKKLPTVPLPTFGGNKWEWDNFAHLFKSQIVDQSKDDLEKFQFLTSALSGNPKKLMSEFQATSSFQEAFDLLEKTYGNSTMIVDELLDKLTEAGAESTRISEMKELLHELYVITRQLESKKVNLDSIAILNVIRKKFSPAIQRERSFLRNTGTENNACQSGIAKRCSHS
ncbi:hypothetical protein L596_026324 [Steinernema carpocapsae]|uniref:Uncharacterized protein n=1 Tax=Steinernema carpocapsae TaxID=34508 RepID=A0A4V5ZY46_STECR|nr:hypothetical protein L596_026324 [Steinernema carpocapsae]